MLLFPSGLLFPCAFGAFKLWSKNLLFPSYLWPPSIVILKYYCLFQGTGALLTASLQFGGLTAMSQFHSGPTTLLGFLNTGFVDI